VGLVKSGFSKIKDTRKSNQTYKLETMLNLGFSMFHLKDESLSSYKVPYSVGVENLARVYSVDCLPRDTAFRKTVDAVSPKGIQKQCQPQINLLKSEDILEPRYVLQSLGIFTAVPIGETRFYCSGGINCPHCLVKKSRAEKKITITKLSEQW